MYIAQPSGKRLLSKLFRYKVYSTSMQRNDNLIRTENLKFNQKVSNLYSSGSKQIYKSYATTKILFLLLFIIFSYFIYQFMKPKPQEQSKNIQQEDIIFFENNISEISSSKTDEEIQDINTTIFNENKIYLKITCFPSSCKFRNYSLDLSLDSFLEILSSSNCHIFLTDKKSSNYIDYYASCPLEFEKALNSLENIKQGVHNDTFKENSNMFSTIK